MKIREIMNKEVISITPEENAKQALNRLFKLKISGLPVVDKERKLVGVLTEKNILKNILPSYIDHVDGFVYEENPKSIKKKFMELENIKVSELMHKEVTTIDEDAAVCEVARVMLTQDIRRIPVLDKEKKVVGIVAREDIVKFYAKEAQWQQID